MKLASNVHLKLEWKRALLFDYKKILKLKNKLGFILNYKIKFAELKGWNDYIYHYTSYSRGYVKVMKTDEKNKAFIQIKLWNKLLNIDNLLKGYPFTLISNT